MKIFDKKLSDAEKWVDRIQVGGFTHKASDYIILTIMVLFVIGVMTSPLCYYSRGAVPDQIPQDPIIEKPPEPFYLQYVRDSSEKYGIEANLIHAIILHESKGRVYAKGDAGEFGLMQILPANLNDKELLNPFEPENNIEAGTRYLKKCFDRYKNMDRAISCYNMGINSKFRNEAYTNNVKLYYEKLRNNEYAYFD